MGSEKVRSRQIDMLHGSLLDKILIFTLPLALSSILQQLFNSADVAVAGRFAGNEAMAAVGSNGSVISLLINLFVGLSVGANVVIANYIGQGKEENVRKAVHTTMTLAVFSGFFVLVAGFFIAKPLLILMNTPPEVIDLATLYLRIYFMGMPFIMVYNFGAAILRSTGDTRRPLYCLIISGIINVGLNLLLVIVFDMSVAGVGIATVVANAVSAVIVIYILLHEDGAIRLNIKQISINRDILLKIIRIGAPAGLQGMVFSLSNVCIQTGINSFGADAVAGSAAAVNFEFFTYFVVNAFGQATVTFISQNFGAGEYERCKRIFRMTMLLAMSITAVMSIGFVLGRAFFIRFYTIDQVIIDFAVIRMIHVLTLEFLTATYEISGAALRGMGHSLLPALITVAGSCGLRIAWIYTVFQRWDSLEALYNVYPISWVITGAGVLTAYYIKRKKLFIK